MEIRYSGAIGGPHPRTGTLIRGQDTHAHRDGHRRTQGGDGIRMPRRLSGAGPARLWASAFQPQDQERRRPVFKPRLRCVLRPPQETSTVGFLQMSQHLILRESGSVSTLQVRRQALKGRVADLDTQLVRGRLGSPVRPAACALCPSPSLPSSCVSRAHPAVGGSCPTPARPGGPPGGLCLRRRAPSPSPRPCTQVCSGSCPKPPSLLL